MLSDFPKDRASAEEFDHFLDLLYQLNQAEEAGGIGFSITQPNNWIDKSLIGAGYAILPVFTLSVLALGTQSPPEIIQPVTDMLTENFSENQRDALLISMMGLFTTSLLGIVARQNYKGRHAERGPSFTAQRIDLEIYNEFHKYGEICKYSDTPQRWNEMQRKTREMSDRFQ